MIDLQAIFGGSPALAVAVIVPVQEEDDGGRFADWVRRPDCHGRIGWELPGLPECDRWWVRCDFDDLPEVPVGFSMGTLLKTTPQDVSCCVSGGMADTLDLSSNRPLQGQLRGFDGA